jgi:hypothetical protein
MSLLNQDDPFNPTKYSSNGENELQRVVITDVDMTIGAMIRFMLKWAIASIPASFVIAVFWIIVWHFVKPIFY